MGNKTVIVVLAIALLLLGFIFFFEKGSMTTSERRERDERVFKTFKQDFVDSIVIESTGGETVSLKKIESSEEESERWKIVSHGKLEADESEVRSWLSAIDYLIASRTIKGKDKRSKPRFGLTSPRFKASFTTRGEKTSFVIGADAKSEAVFLALDNVEDEFFAVEGAFLESVDKSIDDLRSKKLVSVALDKAVSIEVRSRDGGYDLRRQKNAWQIDMDGSWILAARDQVDELLNGITDLKALTFVADGADEKTLLNLGLKEGATSIAVQTEDGERINLRVGSSCPGESNRVHVVVTEVGTVACVDEGITKIVSRPKARLREMRPAVFVDDDVSTITLARSSEELIFSKGEDGWQMSGDAGFQLDERAISDLMGALRENRATEIEVGSELVSNLGEPHAKVVLDLTGEDTLDLNFFRDDAGKRTLVRRGGEAALLTVSSEIMVQIRPDSLAFRKRKIHSGDQFDIEKLKIEGIAPQTLKKVEGAWKLISPHELDADGMGARKIAELVAEVEVKRFVSKVASKEHGFLRLFASITAEFVEEDKASEVVDRTASKEVVLELGARTEDGGRYARLRGEDETVFVVGEAYEEALRYPLVARDLIKVDDTNVSKMTIATGNRKVVLEKQGKRWSAKGAPDVDIAKFEKLLADLGGVKAIRADSFIQTDPNGQALLTLQIWNNNQEETASKTTINVESKTTDPEENGYLARTEDVPVKFVVPARIIDDIIAFVDICYQ